MTRGRLRQKSASASGDAGHVDAREASDKVGKSALASGDEHAAVLRRPAASPTSNSPESPSGDRVVTSIYSHGVRIRCLVERRQELTDAVRARRSLRSVWDPNDWRLEMHAMKVEMGDLVVGGWGAPGPSRWPLARQVSTPLQVRGSPRIVIVPMCWPLAAKIVATSSWPLVTKIAALSTLIVVRVVR